MSAVLPETKRGAMNDEAEASTPASWQHDARRDLLANAGDRLALFTRGEGAYLWDDAGKRYLDFLAGIAVNSLGHAHPAFVEAVSAQAATLAHVSNYFATPPQLALAARLKRLAGTGESGRVYFSNSGAEANEAAFKLARLHQYLSHLMRRFLSELVLGKGVVDLADTVYETNGAMYMLSPC